MASRGWIRQTIAAATCAALIAGPASGAFGAQRDDYGTRASTRAQSAYDAGFREGARQGAADARDGRAAGYERDSIYRAGDRGYESSWGNRDAYRTEFRRGFAAGYRQGFDDMRVRLDRRDNDRDQRDRRWGRGYQEPATARGYADGYDKGRDDGRDRDRYDPVRHSDYREADNGYKREYGSKEAYQNNYRTGFRQGYEDGYRDGGAGRR